jgi:hypothetical protein
VAQETALVHAGIHPPTRAMDLLNDPDPDALLGQVLDQAARLYGAGFRLGGRPAPARDTPAAIGGS